MSPKYISGKRRDPVISKLLAVPMHRVFSNWSTQALSVAVRRHTLIQHT